MLRRQVAFQEFLPRPGFLVRERSDVIDEIHERIGEDQKRKWLLGVKIQQISDADKENLSAYLKKRQEEQPLIASD